MCRGRGVRCEMETRLYAGQLSLCHAKTEKYPKKIFVMIDKDGGGKFLDFMGGNIAVMRGDVELMGGGSLPVPPPPTTENPADREGKV